MSEAVPLREHIDQRFDDLEKRFEETRRATAEATKEAKADVDRRLDEMNELRHQIESERGRYVARDVYEQRHEDFTLTLSNLDRRVASMEGGAQIRAGTITWTIAGLGLLLTAVIVTVNLLTG